MKDKNYKPFIEDTQVLTCVDIGFKPGRIPDMFWTCVISCLQPLCFFDKMIKMAAADEATIN